MRRLSRSSVWAIIPAITLLAVWPLGAQQSPRRGGVLRIAHVGEPSTLDTHITGGAIPTHVLTNVYEGLFGMDRKFQPRPMLTERLEVSPDRLTYTFALRKDVRFHNGKEMTSEDARASLERWGRVNVRGRVFEAPTNTWWNAYLER